MSLFKVTPGKARAARDAFDAALTAVMGRVLRSYLADVRRGYSTALATLGDQARRWAAAVDSGAWQTVQSEYETAWALYTDTPLTGDPYRVMSDYITTVRDRLVRGEHFGVTVYEESFDAIRRSIALSTSEGWTNRQLAQRIAAELGWETDGPYWRTTLARLDTQVDGILDPLGAPGAPGREYARLNDPRVRALQAQRAIAVRHLDAERSIWQTRANLIARTESTGTYNHAAHHALTHEGARSKVWISTSDARTRPTHAAADGQEVPVSQPFLVGGALMQYPGDPRGPADEVIGCRCTLIGADALL